MPHKVKGVEQRERPIQPHVSHRDHHWEHCQEESQGTQKGIPDF